MSAERERLVKAVEDANRGMLFSDIRNQREWQEAAQQHRNAVAALAAYDAAHKEEKL